MENNAPLSCCMLFNLLRHKLIAKRIHNRINVFKARITFCRGSFLQALARDANLLRYFYISVLAALIATT